MTTHRRYCWGERGGTLGDDYSGHPTDRLHFGVYDHRCVLSVVGIARAYERRYLSLCISVF